MSRRDLERSAAGLESNAPTVEALRSGEGAGSPLLPEVLTVDELAQLLRVNRKTAYAGLADGTIPGGRWLGKAIRVSREAVLDWLRTGQGRVRSRRS